MDRAAARYWPDELCVSIFPGRKSGTVHYFSYGSNMMGLRLLKSCKTALLYGIVRLYDWKLEFWNLKDGPSERWKGAVATIVHSPGAKLWGVLWRMHESDIPNLDKQEGVAKGIYERITVEPEWADGLGLGPCHSYTMIKHSDDQANQLPSPHYLKVIYEGARQCHMPLHYLEDLSKLPHNGYSGPFPPIMSGLFDEEPDRDETEEEMGKEMAQASSPDNLD